MKDYLFCPIQNCSFRIGVGFNAKSETCEKAIEDLKSHIETHSIQELSKVAIDYVFFVKEDREKRVEKK